MVTMTLVTSTLQHGQKCTSERSLQVLMLYGFYVYILFFY